MRRSIVGMIAVGTMIGIIVCLTVMIFNKGALRRAQEEKERAQGGSIAFGANTMYTPPEVPAQPATAEEVPGTQPSIEESPEEQPASWQPDVTRRIRESQQTLERYLRRFEELRRRVELAYAALGGYRDAIDRFALYSETAESRAVLHWGGQLASQTARLQVSIQDSIDDLRALSTHEAYQQSRLTYTSSLDLDMPKSVDTARIPRNVQPVYDWFLRYAGALREVEREWREGLNPTYTAIVNMLGAEAERARERREDILRPPPDKEGASPAGEGGSK